MQLDVRRSATLSAAIEVMVTMPREAAKATRKYSKIVITPEWKKGLERRATTNAQRDRLVRRSAVYISDRGVRLSAGSSAATAFTAQEEFGGNRDQVTTYRRRSKNGSHTVRRHTQRQFRSFARKGHVVYPTASDLIPRVAALWVQTVYRTVAEVIERYGL